MAIFRYYITDLFSGSIKGTNSTDTAQQYAICEGDFFVVDSEIGKELTASEPVDIPEVEPVGN